MKLSEGILQAVSQFGYEILLDKRIISILADYQAFEDNPTLGNIFKMLIATEEWNKFILNRTFLDLTGCQKLIQFYVISFGLQENLLFALISAVRQGIIVELEKDSEIEQINLLFHPYGETSLEEAIVSNADHDFEIPESLKPIDVAISGYKDIDLPCYIGDSKNSPIVDSLTDISNLLITGSTYQGKSTLLHSVLSGLFLWMIRTDKREQVKFCLVDDLGVELGIYDIFPSFLFATSPYRKKKVIKSDGDYFELLMALNQEKDLRLDIFRRHNVSSIEEYNQQLAKVNDTLAKKIPYIVVAIDNIESLSRYEVELSVLFT